MQERNGVAPTLEVISRDAPPRIVELNADPLTIGRDQRSDIVLRDCRVSTRHALVSRRSDGRHYIEDTDSTNHTYLNGERLAERQPRVLEDDARIRICDFTLIYHQQIVRLEDRPTDETTVIGSLDDLSSLNLITRNDRASVVLHAVLAINRLLGGATELSVALGRALEELFHVFPQAECGFILTGEAGGRMHPVATHRRDLSEADDLRLSRSVLQKVMTEGKGMLLSGQKTDARLLGKEMKSAHESGIRTMLCVPILGGEGVPIGIIQIDTRAAKDPFDSDDLELLSAVAVPIGVVVDNHRLHKMQASLAAAVEVQCALLPHRRPQADGYSFWEYYQPAMVIGGDYYDYIPLVNDPNQSWIQGAVVLADVCGKGIPAALLMANLRAEIRQLVRTQLSLSAVASVANHGMIDNDLNARFVTFLLCAIDTCAHTLRIVNAGHFCPIIRKRDGTLIDAALEVVGFPLGIEAGIEYAEAAIQLDPGDVVVMFTDGVTDAINHDDVVLGLDGVRALIADTPGDANTIGSNLLSAVRAHGSGRPPVDDIAIVCFGRDS